MDNSQAEIVRQLLIDLGEGVIAVYSGNVYSGSPWPVFCTNEPDKPDNCITVYDTAGFVDGRDMFGNINEHLGFQVRVRSANQADGRLKIDAIRQSLALNVLQRGVTVGVNTYTVQAVVKFGPRLALGKEVAATNRSLFTMNAAVAGATQLL